MGEREIRARVETGPPPAAGASATPLIALEAVVIDTETTGLDPAKARLVEIAALPIAAGGIAAAPPFRALVCPDEPIPESATRIHGIGDAAVAQAPRFAEVWPALQAAIGGKVVIGHSLGFDLAVLKRECERAGVAWVRPRSLDTRLLAEVARPNLAGYSLEQLAAWLGVEVTGRHAALADATTTALVFLALVPKLRERGVRTLAEAEQACRTLRTSVEEQVRAGWIEPVEAPGRRDAEPALRRIDTYPYRHRVADVMRKPARFSGNTNTTALTT